MHGTCGQFAAVLMKLSQCCCECVQAWPSVLTLHVLLTWQVDGKVTGSFQSGYLAHVAVNGFTYHAVLFSPYLALNTPGGMYPPALDSTLNTAKPQGQQSADGTGSLPILPEDSGVLDPTTHSQVKDDTRQTLTAPSPVDFVSADDVQSAVPE